MGLDVWICDPVGTRIYPLARYDKLSYTRVVNDIGALEIVLPGDFYVPDARIDGLIMVWRDGRLETETAWLIRGIKRTTDGDGTQKVTLTAVSGIDLLRRRLVAYARGTAYTEKTMAADNMIKAFVRENMGTLAVDTARALNSSLFTVAADTTSAVVIGHDAAWQNLLRACQDIAKVSADNGTDLFFDMVWLPERSTWELRTYVGARGIDKSSGTGAPVTLSIDRGSVGGDVLDDEYRSEVTFVYATGSGTGSTQATTSVGDAGRIGRTPYNRCEALTSVSTADAALLEWGAHMALHRGRPRRMYAADVISTSGSRYGVDWGFGDIVTVYAFGLQLDCRVDAVQYVHDTIGARGREAVRVRLTNTAAL